MRLKNDIAPFFEIRFRCQNKRVQNVKVQKRRNSKWKNESEMSNFYWIIVDVGAKPSSRRDLQNHLSDSQQHASKKDTSKK